MIRILFAGLLLVCCNAAFADDIDNLQALTQTQFRGLSEDLGAVLTFKQLEPATPEGMTGFNLGIGLSGTHVEHTDAWNIATRSSDVSTVPMARIRLTKGLPGGVDVGGYYSAAPNSNVKAYGGELRYAILKGGVLEPALGLRATYNRLTGVDHLDFSTRSLDLSISKGFGPFTPYAGIGRIWTSSDPDASLGLHSESFGNNEAFVGFRVSLVVLTFSLEASRVGGNTTYAAGLGVGF
ncbi:MAG TPA: hypothetical protein VFL54_05785 [Gammaproteobacteria bacterium]|nr:hypothetical protein [Gammaproteobacteria bacterium]